MSDTTVIQVQDANVEYRVYEDRQPRAGRRLSLRAGARTVATVHAVRGVSFSVEPGEVVGVIGTNGSGKSSLLRAIAGLQPVDSGSILVRGEPALLGVGAVLNKQLSGARNVMLGCMALGLSRAEARSRFPAIVEFAGVADAIERPLKTYSSGMKSRLQFAIATSVDPEILLIDEALAVGDREFKRRSEKRIRRLRRHAKVVIVVSHNMGVIRKVCNRVLWLDQGRLVMDGKPRAVIQAYRKA